MKTLPIPSRVHDQSLVPSPQLRASSVQDTSLRKYRTTRFSTLSFIAIAVATAWLPSGELRANPGYKAKSGKVAFNVDANVAFLKVSGSSSAIKGGGEATISGDVATIRGLRFEVDPKTLKTGIDLRDQHMYEKVFTAADGSIPPLVLRADRFEARRNPKTSKWEGNFQAQVSIRGVTKPVRFRASAEQKNPGAIVSAEGVIKTSDFGVKPISYSGAAVNNEVTVTVSNLRIEP
jgi:polyisoprenoid-binding protein YceI